MNAIFRLLLGLLFAAGLPAAAQTNAGGSVIGTAQTNAYRLVLVTNWVQPWASLRVVNGQLYDVNYSQLWQSVTIPEGATVLNARYYGYVQPTDLTFTWTWRNHEGHDRQYTIMVYNFPYDPVYFTHPKGDRDLILTAVPLALRLFPVNIQTNWTPLGREFIGTQTYDFGVACTNLVPVPTWQRVPITAPEVATAPAVVPPSVPPATPAADSQTTDRDYYSGTLSNRLERALNLSNTSQRDAFLQILANDSARAGDVTMVKNSLFNISSEFLHDNAAASTAQILARQGLHVDAFQIASSINNPQHRALIIKLLNF